MFRRHQLFKNNNQGEKTMTKCNQCKGKGTIFFDELDERADCPSCEGTGIE